MSFRAYVVCEDHTLDQYVVLPIVKALLTRIGKPLATVKPVTSPRLNGISQVEAEFEAIATRYSSIGDLVVFAVDRDAEDGLGGRKNRQAAFDARLARLDAGVRAKTKVVLAVEECEVWAIWGSRSDIAANWSTVRAERDSKERYFDPLTTKLDLVQPGAGRSRLTQKSLSAGWDSLASGCPELRQLQTDIAGML